MPSGPPGAIVLVNVGGRRTIVTAGVAEFGSRQAIMQNETFRVASVSKAFSGAVALSLVREHLLRLSDTVGATLPTLPTSWAHVTLAQLLRHTSRLPDYIKSKAFLADLKNNPQMDLTPTQLLDYVANEDPEPGTGYDYSDTDNIVIGLMVEAVTHGTYGAALADQVTTQLDLKGTSLPSDATLPTPYVHGYDVEPGDTPVDLSMFLNPALAWASGGMLSTPDQLDRFMRAYVSGAFTDAATRRAQFSFVPGNSGPPGPGVNAAGLAIFRYQTACGTMYGHTGNFPGYTTFAAATSNGKRSAEVMVNEQLNDNPATPEYTALRKVYGLAVCAALGR